MKLLFSILGGALSLLGGTLCVVANFNFGTLFTLVLGCFLLLCGLFYRKVQAITDHGIGRFLKVSVLILFCIEVVLVLFLAVFGMTDTVDYTEDALIVLGAGIRGDQVTQTLQFRLDSAIEYYEKHPNTLIVVSGGKGLQETITEAEAMERYLLTHGIPQESVIKEERATSTRENMDFSKEILDAYFGKDYKVAVITNDFHIYRGTEYAKRAGFAVVTHKSADMVWYNYIPCYLRESFAVLKLWILE